MNNKKTDWSDASLQEDLNTWSDLDFSNWSDVPEWPEVIDLADWSDLDLYFDVDLPDWPDRL